MPKKSALNETPLTLGEGAPLIAANKAATFRSRQPTFAYSLGFIMKSTRTYLAVGSNGPAWGRRHKP